MINTQLGLLMERIFWNRVVADIRCAVGKHQTVYRHRCEYHALAFHEVAAARLHMGVGLVALLGDLVGAFPKTWRELVVIIACLEANVTGSRLMLLKAFLRHTAVEVSYSGRSVLETGSGLPEGGLLGPLCYPLLPLLLDKSLAAAGAGVGVDVSVEQVLGLSALSPESAPALAASDRCASQRLHILHIADDQIIPESSTAKLQEAANLATEWAAATGQEYHVDHPDKTAVLLVGQAALPQVYERCPVMLAARPVPCVLSRKWCGITWDALLSFIPFLEARIGAAREAFNPLCALVREGSAPLEEARAVMRSTVEGTLFFGAMFLIFAPGASDSLDSLQLEFERSLTGFPPWTHAALVRAVGGWRMSWGERIVYDALVFRAELWCAKEGLLVCDVWKHAQNLPGNTFALRSRQLLEVHEVPEIFDFPGWGSYVDEREPVLPAYKRHVRAILERRSSHAWVTSVRSLDAGSHILTQPCPMSVGGRLLELGHLSSLRAAAEFDVLRVGIMRLSLAVPGTRHRRCILCNASEHGLPHVLAACSASHAARVSFLASVDAVFSAQLSASVEGDWPPAVLSPHQGEKQLVEAVWFAAELVRMLRLAQ